MSLRTGASHSTYTMSEAECVSRHLVFFRKRLLYYKATLSALCGESSTGVTELVEEYKHGELAKKLHNRWEACLNIARRYPAHRQELYTLVTQYENTERVLEDALKPLVVFAAYIRQASSLEEVDCRYT